VAVGAACPANKGVRKGSAKKVSGTAASAVLFDHLIGAGEHVEAQSPNAIW